MIYSPSLHSPMKRFLSLSSKTYFHIGISILLIWVLYLLYPFYQSDPDGLHFIRQTDSLSFVYGYLQNDWNLFAPSTLNLSSNEGKAACEFPILYYLAALFSNVFGNPSAVLKSIHILVFITGIYFLGKTFRLFVTNWILSVFGLGLVFSSTILLYYAGSTLPDAPAFGFTLIGIFFSCSAIQSLNKRHLNIAFTFLALASLIKITYAIYLISLPAVVILFHLFPIRKIVVLASLSMFFPIAWSIYSNWYNAINQSQYFLTTWAPIWSLSSAEIQIILDYQSRYWRSNFYYQSTQHFFLIACIFLSIQSQKSNRLLLSFGAISLLGCCIYLILFFEKFKDHDYYLLVFIPCFSMLLISFLIVLEKMWINKYVKVLSFLGLALLFVLSNNYCRIKLNQRFNRESDIYSIIHDQLRGFEETMENEKNKEDTRFLVIGDHTMNGSLVFLQRPGITIPGSKLNDEQLKETIEKERINCAIVLDATYTPNWLETIGFKKLTSENQFQTYLKN